jgi:GTP 3',8-cyclase
VKEQMWKIGPATTVKERFQHLREDETLPILDACNRPLNYLRISITEQCNFRCPYCLPDSTPSAKTKFSNVKDYLSCDEIVRFAKIMIALGVGKIRITGGEPLLRHDLPEIIKGISKNPKLRDLTLTTNGFLLKTKAGLLKKSGLHRLTVSLDSVTHDVFSKMCGHRAKIQDILEGITIAKNEGFHPIKINAVIIKGINEDSVLELVKYSRKEGHIVRFIEYMDAGNCHNWHQDLVVPNQHIVDQIHKEFPLENVEKKNAGEVSSRYRFLDGKGEIGFISSVTQPFCRDCSRIRISPKGKVYNCLFAEQGFNLKPLFAAGISDSMLKNAIKDIWAKRDDRYSENRLLYRGFSQTREKPEMFQIGG